MLALAADGGELGRWQGGREPSWRTRSRRPCGRATGASVGSRRSRRRCAGASPSARSRSPAAGGSEPFAQTSRRQPTHARAPRDTSPVTASRGPPVACASVAASQLPKPPARRRAIAANAAARPPRAPGCVSAQAARLAPPERCAWCTGPMPEGAPARGARSRQTLPPGRASRARLALAPPASGKRAGCAERAVAHPVSVRPLGQRVARRVAHGQLSPRRPTFP